MKVLITGGAGFLGLHLAHFLDKKGVKNIIFDLHIPDPKEYPLSTVFVQGDVRDKKALTDATKNVDAVVHAAAALPLWKKSEILSINVGGTKTVLEAAKKNKLKHVIYISSTAVYGVPKKHPIYEDDPVHGVGAYGESKIQAERLSRQYQKEIPVTIIRPKTFVGTGRLGVFEILFDWVKDGKRIPVIGKGKNRYQLLDVDDLVEALYLILIENKKEKTNTAFNIGAEKFRTVKQDLQELFDFAKSGSKLFPTPANLSKKALFVLEKLKLSPLYQWVYETADHDSFVSIDRLTKTLKWHPKYSNAQALIKSYKWYLKHYDEIKSKTPGITHTVGWNQGILRLLKKAL